VGGAITRRAGACGPMWVIVVEKGTALVERHESC
jgi:hypothetical protein